MSLPTPPLSPLQRAFLALQDAEARLAERDLAAREPIAVIGLACRVPGAADAEAFWRLMRDGVDAITPVPQARWDHAALHDPDPAAPGRIATGHGGFLDQVDGFDPQFFGISPREADGMDPQQRLLLEVAWEALDHAGQAQDRLQGSRTGVYVGACSSDYAYLQLKAGDTGLLDGHFTSGIAHSVFSGRLSYLLGLQGPSLTVDTACSSSLVAVHLACRALRGGECRMALAGGVNLILAPDLFIALSQARMLAPDGRCKTFDAAADGFARGEGCGIVVLKRRSDAIADGDRILALIRGSAVNQDGPSGSLSAPNGPAQEAVIREALADAGLAPDAVGVVEAHGTGTRLGDPLELRALAAVFCGQNGAARRHPLVLGSVKTNIGHLEAAAGVAGLIKLVLALRHGTIPAHLHFSTPTPHVPWAELPFAVPRATIPWESHGAARVAGISAFGFSGTNAHLVIEEAPPSPVEALPAVQAGLFPLSAHAAEALPLLAGRILAALDRQSGSLADLCHTATVGRAHLAHRATVLAGDTMQLRAGLAALAGGRPAGQTRVGRHVRRDPPRIAFLFTGQGAQYSGMARGLYDTAPAFRAAMDRCAAILDGLLDAPLLDLVFGAPGQDGGMLDRTACAQPALFAVEYALVALWRAWGITPMVVIGHSLGEYVAACVAGMFSLEDGLRLVAARGRLMDALPAGGAMAAVSASERQVARAIGEAPVSIAAVNGAMQTVISGSAGAVDAVCRALLAEGHPSRRLPVSHAFHSALMDPVLDAFEREAACVRLSPPQLRLISNLTGKVAEAAEIVRSATWRAHLRQPVRFADGMHALAAVRPDICIEIGPQPILLPLAAGAFSDGSCLLVPSMRRGVGEQDRAGMLDALASVYLAGGEPDWRGVAAGSGGRLVDLPGVPFARRRHWFKAAPPPAIPVAPGGAQDGLLGGRLRAPPPGLSFEATLSAERPGFVRDHRVLGQVVLPATAYLEMLVAGGRQAMNGAAVHIEDVLIGEAMLLAEDGAGRLVHTAFGAPVDGVATATISSLPDGADTGWTRHATARLRAGPGPQIGAACPARLREVLVPWTTDAFYRHLADRGLDFGPQFRSVSRLWRGENQALGEVALPAALAGSQAQGLHPVLLDGCLQVIAAALPEADGGLHLPIAIGRYSVLRPGLDRCWSHVTLHPQATGLLRADVHVLDDDGMPVAVLHAVTLKRVDQDVLRRPAERWLDDCLYETVWRPASLAQPASPASLAAAGARRLDTLAREAGIDAYDRALPAIEALCQAYALCALRRLGWQPEPGVVVTAHGLAESLGVVPRHRRLFARLLAILGGTGWLVPHGAGWHVLRRPADTDPDAELGRLQSLHPAAGAELALVGRVAGALADALRGERDPAGLLFPEGAQDLPERLYRDSPTARLFNGLMAEVLAAVAGEADRPLRILEVGAGTGGTTAHVLSQLGDTAVEYTFTDIGPSFVARARARFGARPGLRFSVLDLELDPATQGFGPGTFDVVVAANVIHATADLRRTLARVHGLLAPHGLLALLEVTAPQGWFDLTVGLTEGWWAFTDLDLRPDYATLTRAAWLQLLPQCGFADAVALPAAASGQGSLALQSILLARARPSRRHWLVLADAGGTATALAERLRSGGDRCTLVRRGPFACGPDTGSIDPDDAADYRKLLEGLQDGGGIDGVVHAWSLDAPSWDESDPKGRTAASPLLLAQALLRQMPVPRLWLLTRGGQPVGAADRALSPLQAATWGLARTLALAHPELRPVCLDLDPDGDPTGLDTVDALAAELRESGNERQVAFRAGQRRVARLARLRQVPAGPADATPWRLEPSTPGSIDAFARVPLHPRPPGPGEVQIAVEATGLNFKDLLNGLGLYPGNPGPLGGECAGRVLAVGNGVDSLRPGDAVLAVAGGSLASVVTARATLVRPLPRHASMAEGATFPIAHLTAVFGLVHLAGLRAGERVLIHAAAGGVGLAAVRLALRTGAEVFATAGAPWKREMLRAIGVQEVFDSRTADFAAAILERTEGRGVEVVLNTLGGALIEPGFQALAQGGRFVELGKRGIKSADWVAKLGRDIRYFVVDWGETAETDPALIGGLLTGLVAAWDRGELASLPRHDFPVAEASRAFRLMAQARHVGRIALLHRPSASAGIRRDGSYLVTGGLSGLGLLAAGRLAEQGAGRLVLIGRRGATAEAAPVLARLRAGGTEVLAEAADVADPVAMGTLLRRVRRDGPPLRGVLHGAGVLEDAGVLQQTPSGLARVFAPKVEGALLLDRLTRADPLDHFVLFSSVAAVLGSAGQANHAAANAVLDLLAHERRSRGLPGLAIDWGAWSEVGAAADRDLAERLAVRGLGTLTPAQGLLALERLMQVGATQVTVLSAHWSRYLAHAGQGETDAFLSEIAGGLPKAAPVVAAPAPGPDLAVRLSGAPAGRRPAVVATFLREQLVRALGLDPARPLDPRAPFGEMGLDSLLAVELRNTLGRLLGRTLPATLLFDHPTLDALTGAILHEMQDAPATSDAPPRQAAKPDLIGAVEELSDAEIDRMLARRRHKQG